MEPFCGPHRRGRFTREQVDRLLTLSPTCPRRIAGPTPPRGNTEGRSAAVRLRPPAIAIAETVDSGVRSVHRETGRPGGREEGHRLNGSQADTALVGGSRVDTRADGDGIQNRGSRDVAAAAPSKRTADGAHGFRALRRRGYLDICTQSVSTLHTQRVPDMHLPGHGGCAYVSTVQYVSRECSRRGLASQPASADTYISRVHT